MICAGSLASAGSQQNQMTEQNIDLSEIPEITEEQMKRATLRVDGEAVAESKGQGSIHRDSDVATHSDAQAGQPRASTETEDFPCGCSAT